MPGRCGFGPGRGRLFRLRSLLVIGATATVFTLFLVRNGRNAEETVRAEDEAVEHLVGLAQGPRGPPHSAGGYRFRWADGGDLPPLLLASPEGKGVCLFAATEKGAVYAFELFDAPPPDVTLLRIHAAREAAAPPLPPGWRKIR